MSPALFFYILNILTKVIMVVLGAAATLEYYNKNRFLFFTSLLFGLFGVYLLFNSALDLFRKDTTEAIISLNTDNVERPESGKIEEPEIDLGQKTVKEIPPPESSPPSSQGKTKPPYFGPDIIADASTSVLVLKHYEDLPFSPESLGILTNDKSLTNEAVVQLSENMQSHYCSGSEKLKPLITVAFFKVLVSCLSSARGYLPGINPHLLNELLPLIKPFSEDVPHSQWASPLMYMMVAVSDNALDQDDIKRMKLALAIDPFDSMSRGARFSKVSEGTIDSEFAIAFYNFLTNNPGVGFNMSPAMKSTVEVATDSALAGNEFTIDTFGVSSHSALYEIYGKLGQKYNF